MINGLLITTLVVVSLLITIMVFVLIKIAIIDFQYEDYLKGITTILSALLVILWLIIVWFSVVRGLY